MNIIIRLGTEDDLPEIVRIYNESIPGGWSTADTKPIAVQDRIEWFRKFDPQRRPIWVVEMQGEVAGWASLSSFYAGRPAYDATAEISMYIDPAFQKQGLGRKLKQFVIDAMPAAWHYDVAEYALRPQPSHRQTERATRLCASWSSLGNCSRAGRETRARDSDASHSTVERKGIAVHSRTDVVHIRFAMNPLHEAR